ncbi:CPBP family intramembrane glutamic endopeptidase [Adhaeretor mobilis]|uniref:CAAX amino terminal protease self-immunity n=1 Tax=Adhaeretor mobilis TaxID=1930276 RepID=A0A517MUS4_9BACT|nr:CPBP family intramembrane glutamic endopeptidase [Adhaeretor mobilis]QDS98626.1 CAAX amino terminal protease self- immunity [Adhaeretor mobilis]
MPVEEVSSASQVLIPAVAAASMVTIGYLANRLASGKPLLEYRPRVSVPWPLTAVLLLQVLTLVNVISALVNMGRATELPSNETFIMSVWSGAFTMSGVAIATYFLLNILAGANSSDLGLPSSTRELFADVGLGIVAFFACILPVSLLDGLLHLLVPSETKHPFIEQMLQGDSPGMFAAIAIAATIPAPLFEETAFRLVLQGWLEKWEDRLTGFTATLRRHEPMRPEGILELDSLSSASADIAAVEVNASPQRRLVTWLPHGWLPIIVSATIFGLAHLGHGWAPVSLIPLGLVLGYLYQRTHRIVPCMTLHAVFNAFSMIRLWLIISEP